MADLERQLQKVAEPQRKSEEPLQQHISRETKVEEIVPGLSAYRVEPVRDNRPTYVLAQDSPDCPLKPLTIPYEQFKIRKYVESVIENGQGNVEERQRLVIGARRPYHANFEFIKPNAETGMISMFNNPADDVGDFDYDEKIGALVGRTGASKFVIDADTGSPVTEGYNDLFRGQDGQIWGQINATDSEPAKKTWYFKRREV